MDRYVFGIFPSLRKITPRHSRPVYTYSSGRDLKKMNQILTEEVYAMTDKPIQVKIRARQQTVKPPRSDSSVCVVPPAARLQILESKPLKREKTINCRQRRSKHPPASPVFHFSDENFFRTGATAKKMAMEHGADASSLVAQPSEPFGPITGEPEAIAIYQPSECRKSEMRNHEDVK